MRRNIRFLSGLDPPERTRGNTKCLCIYRPSGWQWTKVLPLSFVPLFQSHLFTQSKPRGKNKSPSGHVLFVWCFTLKFCEITLMHCIYWLTFFSKAKQIKEVRRDWEINCWVFSQFSQNKLFNFIMWPIEWPRIGLRKLVLRHYRGASGRDSHCAFLLFELKIPVLVLQYKFVMSYDSNCSFWGPLADMRLKRNELD